MSTKQQARQDVWFAHMRSWRESGLNQGAYCALHGLKVASLGYWIARDKATRVPLTLVPGSVAASTDSTPAALVLQSPSGRSVSVLAGVSAEWLDELFIYYEK